MITCAKVILWLLVVVILTVLGRVVYEVKNFKVTSYRYRDQRIKKPYRVAVLADLHDASYGPDNARLLAAIKEAKVRAIWIAGDLITARDGQVKCQNAKKLLKSLCVDYPVFYEYGNHERRARENQELYNQEYFDFLKELRRKKVKGKGLVLMNNRMISFYKIGISLSGLDLPMTYYYRSFKGQPDLLKVKERIGEPEEGLLPVLLAHHPRFFSVYEKAGAKLVISGHHHGGIVRLPGIGGLISTQGKLFEKYDRGIFQEGDATMILSAGLGSHTVNVRFLNQPELLVLDLLPENDN